MKKLFVFVLCIISSHAMSGNNKTRQGIEYPSWERFIDDKEHSRVDASCKEVRDKSGNIICTFNQVIILRKNTVSEERNLSDLKMASKDEIQKTLNSLMKFCTKESQKNFNESYQLHPTQEARKMHQELMSICRNPSRESLIKLYENNLDVEKSTCTIFDKTYTQEFKYNFSMKKWKNIDDDSGGHYLRDCGIIEVEYLEQDPRKGWDFSWNYRTRTIVTNKTGSALGIRCSTLTEGEHNVENEIISYGLGSLMYETHQAMNCKYINLTEY